MRVFRIAIPASQIDRSRAFYELVLGVEADLTVPSRVYFHCGAVIVAVIDWAFASRSATEGRKGAATAAPPRPRSITLRLNVFMV